MSTIPPSDPSQTETLRAEARRRGVSVYRVRADRAARSEGAPTTHIPWHKIERIQVETIRENVKRRYWRRVVNIIISNMQHYTDTGDTINEYPYWEELHEIIDVAWIGEIDPDLLKYLDYYHPTARY